ncbi:hypothetical protein Lepil_3603 [Leptonema illini DSM 21528]|uniref:Uncharacterized protein n=2 Tax=Leptonema illini TaxID=183 RepID=H2CKF5_9LEPT|nr:hypothetical protein Lepil_3603 [Leptonema illini DSM 21528]
MAVKSRIEEAIPVGSIDNWGLVHIFSFQYSAFFDVINALNENRIIDLKPECPECSALLPIEELSKPDFTCPECGSKISIFDVPAFSILVSKDNHADIRNRSYENLARLLSEYSVRNGEMFYLLCDIEGSQLLQKKDPPAYNHYISRLWSVHWPSVLDRISRAYLPLLANGDAIIIAFLSLEDCLSSIERLSLSISSEPFRLSAHLDIFYMDSEEAVGFVRRLDEKWDFNSIAVTNFHRVAEKAKPDSWRGCKDYKIKACFLNQILHSSYAQMLTNKYSLKAESYAFVDKHGHDYKGDMAGICL